MVKTRNLKCDAMDNPIGIDISHPRLSWQLVSDRRNTVQKAYQLVVSTSLEEAENGIGNFMTAVKKRRIQQ